MLALGIAGLAGGVALDVLAPHLGHGAAIAVIVLSAVVFVAVSLDLSGLTPVAPGRARVIQLFGSYRGAIHDPGTTVPVCDLGAG